VPGGALPGHRAVRADGGGRAGSAATVGPVRAVPKPSSIVTLPGQMFTLRPTTRIVTVVGVEVAAHTAAGLFYGVQTLRRLLPATVESSNVQSGPWPVRGVAVHAWRGRDAGRGKALSFRWRRSSSPST
jgi:hypothetical protein